MNQKQFGPKTPKPEDIPPHEQYIVDVLLNCAVGGTIPKDRSNITPTPAGIQPCAAGQKGVPLVVPVTLRTLDGISHIRVFLPKDLRQDQARETVWKSVLEVHRRFPDGVGLLDPIDNMGIKDDKFKELVKVHSAHFNDLRTPYSYIQILENICNGTEDVREPATQGPSAS